MSRSRAVSKKKFLEAYQKSKNIVDLAIELGICEMTVRNYLHKLSLEVPGKAEKQEFSFKIYNAYQGRITLNEMTKKFGLDLIHIRYHLKKAMMLTYSSKDKPKWPIPRILSHIKIVHALGKNPTLINKIDMLVEKTGLSEGCINIYLKYVHNCKQDISKPKKAKKKFNMNEY